MTPFERVGPFTAGMTRKAIRAILGEPAHPDRHGRRDVFPYGATYVLAHYEDDLDTLESIEIDTHSTLRIYYEGVPMHGSLATIAKRLSRIGATFGGHATDESFAVPSAGVWLWVPDGRRSPKTVCIDLVRMPSRVGTPVVPWEEHLEHLARLHAPHSRRWQQEAT